MTTVVPTRLEAIRLALQRADDDGLVYVCHGPPNCRRNVGRTAPTTCQWCLVVQPGEQLTAEEIEAEIVRQQRGH